MKLLILTLVMLAPLCIHANTESLITKRYSKGLLKGSFQLKGTETEHALLKKLFGKKVKTQNEKQYFSDCGTASCVLNRIYGSESTAKAALDEFKSGTKVVFPSITSASKQAYNLRMNEDCENCNSPTNSTPEQLKWISDSLPFFYKNKNLDIKSFCYETKKSGVIEGHGNAFDVFENAEKNGVFEENFRWSGAWTLAEYPNENFKKKSYEWSLLENASELSTKEKLKLFLTQKGANLSKKDFSNWGREEGIYPESSERYLKEVEDSLKESKPYDETASKLGSAQKYLLCSHYNLFKLDKCKQGLELIQQRMTPFSGDEVLFDLHKEVFSSDKYLEGARNAAKKVYNKIEDPNYSNCSDNSKSLLEDIIDGYKEAGFTEKDANDAAWKILALSSTHGANSSYSFSPWLNSNNSGFRIFSVFFTSGAQVLDSRSLRCGKTYSYPKELQTTCDYGKPYHFWMAAYLAREVAKKTGSPSAGRNSAWLAELGYQMLSKSALRDPNRAFVSDTYSPANNKIRLDLAFAAAGATFGANDYSAGNAAKVYNVDNAIKNLLGEATVLEPLDQNELEKLWSGTGLKAYKRWRKIFSPDVALSSY